MRSFLYALPWLLIYLAMLGGLVVFIAFVVSMVKKTLRRRH